MRSTNTIIRLEDMSKIGIVSYSDDSAMQANKNVSTIEMHAPYFQVFEKPVVFDGGVTRPDPTPDVHPDYDADDPNYDHFDVLAPSVMASFFGEANDNVEENSRFYEREPYILGVDGNSQVCKLTCNTSKGFPSYIMLYLEDFGADYADPDMVDSIQSNMGTDLFIGGHPKIMELSIKLFGQEFPITKKLEGDDLVYLTKKNSHPRCNFYEHMAYDPIVLLKLEDLGLCTESVGYPLAKRLEMEIEIRQIMLPANWGNLYEDRDEFPNFKMTARAVFIYENHVLEGSNGSCNFVWKY